MFSEKKISNLIYFLKSMRSEQMEYVCIGVLKKRLLPHVRKTGLGGFEVLMTCPQKVKYLVAIFLRFFP